MARFWESFIFIATFTFAFHNGVTNAVTHTVATTSQFQAALRAVLPGDVIILQDNTEFNGFFRAEVSGTAQDRIVIQGTSTSVLTGWSSAFNLEASYYTLRGICISARFVPIFLYHVHLKKHDFSTFRIYHCQCKERYFNRWWKLQRARRFDYSHDWRRGSAFQIFQQWQHCTKLWNLWYWWVRMHIMTLY